MAGPFDIVAFGLLAGGAALGAWLLERRASGQRWLGMAHAVGLQVVGEPLLAHPTLRTVVDGLEVRVTLTYRSAWNPVSMKVESTPFTVIEVDLPEGVTPGLLITHEDVSSFLAGVLGGQDIQVGDPLLDDRLRIRGEDEEVVRFVFNQPSVRDALLILMTEHRRNRVVGGRVVIEHFAIAASDTRMAIAGAVRLARALGDASEGPWKSFCRRHGLTDTGQKGRQRFEGTLEGLPVEVRVGGSARAGATVRIDVPAGLPTGLRIEAAGHGERPGAVRLGDPVLDTAVSVAAFDAEATRALLRDDDLRGDLLAVVHGYPGSRVAQGAVWLHTPQTGVEAVEAGLRVALALARRLDGRVRG